MLKYINDSCYTQICDNIMFVMQKGNIGVYGSGRCWRLTMLTGGHETVIACFVISDDGYKCYKTCCESRLWTENEILSAANKMIEDITSS